MTFVEKSGRTLDDAIDAALVELEVERGNVDIEVLETPSKGFLGFGSKDAKVRVTIVRSALEEMEAVYAEAQKNKVAAKKPAMQAKSVTVPEQTTKKPAAPVKSAISQPLPAAKKTENRPVQTVQSAKAVPVRPVAKQVAEVKANVTAGQKPVVEDDGIDAAADAKKFLNELLTKMRVKDFVIEKLTGEDGYIRLNIHGKDLGVLIGKHGYNLDSLQYLTNLVGNRDAGTKKRFILDIEGYRVRRAETLTRLAIGMANKVKRSGKPMAFEPMSPHERKVIHSALQRDRFVTTHSDGEEPNRKIVVTPKNAASSGAPARPFTPRANNKPRPRDSAGTTNTLVK